MLRFILKKRKKKSKLEYRLPDSEGILYYNVLEKKVGGKIRKRGIIYGLHGAVESLVIPSTIEKEKIYYIRESAFSGNQDLKEIVIPKFVKTLRKNAFFDCVNLKKVVFSSKIERIEDGCFEGCISLENFVLPRTIKTIGDRAFAGCKALHELWILQQLDQVGTEAFPKETVLWCTEEQTCSLLKERGYTAKVFNLDKIVGPSEMIPVSDSDTTAPFFSMDKIDYALAYFGNMMSGKFSSWLEERNLYGEESRYAYCDGKYVLRDSGSTEGNTAKILLLGNLQRNEIKDVEESEEFEEFEQPEESEESEESKEVETPEVTESYFDPVKEILQKADLSIVNCGDVLWNDQAKIGELNQAGIDLLMHSSVSTSPKSASQIYQHLDMLNCGQVMHTGLSASKRDKGYILLDIHGIQIGVLSYVHDRKIASEKRRVLFPNSTKEELRKSITCAKEDGAEFILVYGWSKEANIDSCMKQIAEAGADYIFGCGTEEIRPYQIIRGQGNREVPAIVSGGSISGGNGPAAIFELMLKRNDAGDVVVEHEGYYPCLMEKQLLPAEGMQVRDLETQIELESAYLSIRHTMGNHTNMECLTPLNRTLLRIPGEALSTMQRDYEIVPRVFKKHAQKQEEVIENAYTFDAEKVRYCRSRDEAIGEAVITCVGQIEYDRIIERSGECLGEYNFLQNFKPIAECLSDGDFAIGNFSTMSSAEYPGMGDVSINTIRGGYKNCRTEFVHALKRAGFHGLAAANMHNACLGVEGILDTEEQLRQRGLVSSGIGRNKNPIVEINGISVGLLSVTANCINDRKILTSEGISRFLNVFDFEGIKAEVQALKDGGAEFILTYLYCGTDKRGLSLELRREAAEHLAECGSDYVICTVAREVGARYSYRTKDERTVPIIESLGSFIAGREGENTVEGALLKLYLRRTLDGSIALEERYVPMQIKRDLLEADKAIVVSRADSLEEQTGLILGQEIKCDTEPVVKWADPYQRTLTIEEIYQILGKEPSKSDLSRLGEKYKRPVSCVAVRQRYMQTDGVAVMYKYSNFIEATEIEWSIEDCINAGVSLVIDNTYHEELPCIVVDEPLMDVFGKLTKHVRDWYQPVTVAITGSMGKTTTKEMMTKVFDTHYRTFCAEGNSNAIYQIGQFIQKLSQKDEAYIQEVHGGTPNTAAFVSEVISPNICVITNVVENHMSQIGTIENLVKNKLEITKGMNENGVLILCNDNPYLKAASPDVPTIRYSIEDTDCQYYAQNIREDGDVISFDIVSRASQFDEAGVYPAQIFIQGKHNVSNALAVFAAGRQAGIPPYKIISGLSRYRTSGIRQNIIEHGGVTMLLDTYNSNPKALLAMMDVFARIKSKTEGRKILILGMMGEQGEDSPKIHYDAGRAVCQYDFDFMLCYGADAKYLVKAAKECGREAYYFADRETFNRIIADNVQAGDVLLVKGSHAMELDTATLVPIFGLRVKGN